jgi:4-amino-4-deoxy-L-arabinose transferase-like glycosyltransferase
MSPRPLAVILLVASVLSIASVTLHHKSELRNDALSNHDLAVALITRNTYEAPYRPPGYPAFLALVYAIAGPRPIAAYFVQAALFVAALYLVFRIALHITHRERTALIAIGLCALWRPFYLAIPMLLSEILNGFFVAAALLILLLAIEKPGYLLSAAAGILLAINAMIKPTILPFIAVAPCFLLVSSKGLFRKLGTAVTIIIAAMIVITPWVIRNYHVTGHFVPISTGGGMNFWIGNHPASYDGSLPKDTRFTPSISERIVGRTDIEMDSILMADAKAVMREDPLRAAGLFCRKFSRLWLAGLGENRALIGPGRLHIGNFGIPTMAFLQVPLFLAAVAGWFFLSQDSRRRAYPILALLIVWTAAYVIIAADRRYALPVEYYEIFLASVTISRIFQRY